MKWLAFILMFMLTYRVNAQQEQQLENLAEQEETIEDDAYYQQLETLRRHPVNLNTADAGDLQQLQVLSALHIESFLQYRLLLGNLVHIYELQAIPYWEVSLIQKILPYVTIREALDLPGRLSDGRRKGTGTLLLRLSQNTDRPAGYTDTGTGRYLGSPQKAMVRYRYNYKNLLQFGVLADKDAGEPLFNKYRRGFDFYSFHLFIRKLGMVSTLAIGDFTVNLGQGLIHWQSLAFGKGAEVTAGKRQSSILRPYTSAGEYNFHRGLGITLQKKSVQFTAFASLRQLTANLAADSSGELLIRSFLTSGLHRTAAEMADRNSVRQLAVGGNVSYDRAGWHAGGNIIYYTFSHAVSKQDKPYNQFAFGGRQLANISINYDRTWRNLHLFGEVAFDSRRNKAVMKGLLASLDPRLDISMMVRHLQRGFNSLYANAFTESTLPSNESGLFAGFSFKPVKGVRIDAYSDVFYFPWLKFGVNEPSTGKEFLVQLAWAPSKKLEIISRFRYKGTPRTNWRTHITWYPMPSLRMQQRLELVWYHNNNIDREQGFMVFSEAAFDHPTRPYGITGRIQLFETDGFNSRIYAFEQDIASAFSIPAVYHKGVRYYINIKTGLDKLFFSGKIQRLPDINVYLRWAQTIYRMQSHTALGAKSGPNKGEYKIQLIFSDVK